MKINGVLKGIYRLCGAQSDREKCYRVRYAQMALKKNYCLIAKRKNFTIFSLSLTHKRDLMEATKIFYRNDEQLWTYKWIGLSQISDRVT